MKKTILYKIRLTISAVCILFLFNYLIVRAEQVKAPVDSSRANKGNSPVILQDISIYESGTTISASSLTPQRDYDIKITVIDNDCIGNSNGGLDELIVKLWYDKDGDDVLINPPDKSIFNSYNNYNPQNSLKIKWVRGGTASLTGGGTTWSLNQSKSILPNSNNYYDTTFEFVFNITVGKVAKEASITNKWQIAAKVVDVDGFESYRAFENTAGFGIQMDFYGEIVMSSINLDINSLYDNSNNGEIIYEIKDISYISNSGYNKTVNADNLWVNSNNSKNLLLRMYNADVENTFALKVNNKSDLSTAKILPLNESDLVIEEDSPASTSEQQKKESNFLYILLNKNFNKDIYYKGTITYGINNGL